MPEYQVVVLEDEEDWLAELIESVKFAGRGLPEDVNLSVEGFTLLSEARPSLASADLLILDIELLVDGTPKLFTATKGLTVLKDFPQLPAIVVSSGLTARQAWDLGRNDTNVIDFFGKGNFDEREFAESIQRFTRDNSPRHRAPAKPTIFVSYSSQDATVAERLVRGLRQAGVPGVWIDMREIQPGDEIVKALTFALESAETLLLLISEHSLTSRWVSKEWETSLFRDVTIIPLKLDASEVPTLLKGFSAVDLRTDENKAIQALARRLLRPDSPRLTGH